MPSLGGRSLVLTKELLCVWYKYIPFKMMTIIIHNLPELLLSYESTYFAESPKILASRGA